MRKAWRTSVCGWLAAAAVTALPLAAQADDPAPPPAQAAQQAPPVATTGNILILPFTPVNPNDARPWIGRSIQDSLIADLTVSAPSRVLTSNDVANGDEQAVALGRRLGAHYVVVGSFVSSDPDLRITGKVIDVETAQPIGGLKVTGAPDQIFHLEDGIAMQVKSRLMPDVLAAQQRMAGQNAPPTQPAEGQYTGVQNGAPLSSYYSTYTYPAPSSYYDQYYYTSPAYYYGGPAYVDYPLWSYPYYYSPFFSFGFSFRDGFHHHDFDHGHFDHGHFDHGHFDGRTGFSGHGTFAGGSFSGRTFGGFSRSSGFSGGHSFGGGMHSGGSVGAHGGGGGGHR